MRIELSKKLTKAADSLSDVSRRYRESLARRILDDSCDTGQVVADLEVVAILNDVVTKLRGLATATQVTKPAVAPIQELPKKSLRRSHSKHAKAQVFLEPIIAILQTSGGSASVSKIVEALRKNYPNIIKSVRQPGEDPNRPKWLYMVYWCGKRLVEMGKLSIKDGTWTLKF